MVARTGAPRRDLPERFGDTERDLPAAVARWAEQGTWRAVFEALQDLDLEWLLINSTVVQAHPHAAGARHSSAPEEALGRSRGGFSTEVHVARDGLGNPVRVALSPVRRADIVFGLELIDGLDAEAVFADKRGRL